MRLEDRTKSEKSDERTAHGAAAEPGQSALPHAPPLGAEDGAAHEMFAIFEDLRRRLDHNSALAKALEQDLATTRENLHQSEILASSRAREIERLTAEIASLRAEREVVRKELDIAEGVKHESLLEIRRLKQENEKLNRDIEGLRQEIENLTRTKEELRRESDVLVQELKQNLAEQKQRFETVEARLKQRTEELYRDKVAIEDLERDNGNLKNKLDALERSVSAFGKLKDYIKDVRSQTLGEDK